MKKQYLRIVLCLIFFGNATIGNAQSLNKTHKLFEDKAYVEAIAGYEDLKKTPEVLQNLADAYYYLGQMDKAVENYNALIEQKGEIIDRDRNFRYGQALKALNQYTTADIALSEYFGYPQNTSLLINNLRKTVPHDFMLTKIQGPAGTSEFSPAYLNNHDVVFASTRSIENPLFAWNQLPYLNLYQGTIASNGSIQNVTPFSENINTTSHESNATFSRDGTKMYFNRTDSERKKLDGKKVANIKIYSAELIDNEWTNVTALPFNDDSFNNEHPSLSYDGKTLYFASDRSGSYGDFDIYKVAINGDGSYGEPENLGEAVNTRERDQFPYISKINTLYFASNGHPGLGGLDVFRSEMVNNTFSKPVNLGVTVNSGYDDFGFIVNEQTETGFLSSNRDGSDALYNYKRIENILTKYLVEGLVQDKNTKELLPRSLVTLMDENMRVLQDTIVNNTATYLFKIEPNKKYTVRGTRSLYIPYDVEFSTDSKGKISHNIYLTLESYADAEERINKTEKGDVQVQLDPIYFNFDEWDIKPSAAITLDMLVDFMKKYDQMEVEISAHTDARGSDDYNLDLSKKRAASTVEYLVSRGIEATRLRSIGYGELQPLNKCTKENMCTKEEYDINRRSEFKVIN